MPRNVFAATQGDLDLLGGKAEMGYGRFVSAAVLKTISGRTIGAG
ncbi:MAG: hypothetical protein V7704_06185 [Aurantimonas endophytica]